METIEQVETTEQQPVQTYHEFVKERTAPKPEEEESAKAAEPVSTPEKPETPGDSNKPKRDRTAEGRIAELTARTKALEAEREEWRRKAESATAPKAEPAKVETKPEATTGKPQLKDFVAALKGDETYEDAQERWEDAKAEWRSNEAKRVESEKRQQESQKQTAERVQSKIVEAMGKHSDFMEAVESNWILPGIKETILDYMGEADDLDVVYHLAKNPAEVERIAALPKTRQLAELGKIEDRLTVKAAPAAPKPAVSRAPAPIADVKSGGGASGEFDPNDTSMPFHLWAKQREKQKK